MSKIRFSVCFVLVLLSLNIVAYAEPAEQESGISTYAYDSLYYLSHMDGTLSDLFYLMDNGYLNQDVITAVRSVDSRVNSAVATIETSNSKIDSIVPLLLVNNVLLCIVIGYFVSTKLGRIFRK